MNEKPEDADARSSSSGRIAQPHENVSTDAGKEENKDSVSTAPHGKKKYTHAAESQILVHNWPLPAPDPRIYAANLFKSAKGDAKDKKLVSAAVVAEFEDKKVFFSAPAHGALCLNLSNQAFRRAQEILRNEIFKRTSYGLAAEDSLPQLYNLFEQLIANIVFAYTALEAFSNQVVPDDFIFEKIRQDKRCQERYGKDQIERHLSLDIKFSEVIPEITGQEFRKGTTLWNEYASLRDIRDRIIHVKSADLGVKGTNVTSIWADLLKRRKVDSSLVAHRIIKHFPLSHDDSSPVAVGRNRWISLFPFVR